MNSLTMNSHLSLGALKSYSSRTEVPGSMVDDAHIAESVDKSAPCANVIHYGLSLRFDMLASSFNICHMLLDDRFI
jgi:hypothetical protein